MRLAFDKWRTAIEAGDFRRADVTKLQAGGGYRADPAGMAGDVRRSPAQLVQTLGKPQPSAGGEELF